MSKRILFSDNGTLTDFSVELSKYNSGSKSFNYTQNEDYIYIGSDLPFNHIYFKLSSLNSVNAVMSVDYWSSNQWASCVEVIDETEAFKKSGNITFVPEKQTSWQRSSTNHAGMSVIGLESVVIYDLYWIRISFNATLANGTALSWIGQLFSNDEELFSEFPDFARANNMLAFKSGKTNWEEQHVRASELLSNDLINHGIIIGKDQIISRNDYKNACIQKVAEIIYSAMGDDYVDQTIARGKEYKSRLLTGVQRVDKNNNAILDIEEKESKQGFLTR
jgi:hypothetical protein